MRKQFYQEIKRLKKNGLYRSLTKVAGSIGATVSINGRDMILLSSNNYLGLANHPCLKEAAIAVLKKSGTGSGASRLISGNMEIHEELEKRIADFKRCRSALIFSTGYMANIGVIASLAGKGDLVLSDELNHASIIDGCRLSGAEIKVYPHRDIKALNRILSNNRKPHSDEEYNKRFIITDGIFSMDGDIAPLPEILKAAKNNNAFVIVDDAHATGVLGETGKGTAEYFGINNDKLIQIGTFSKALGSLGGFVAGDEILIECIRNKSRSFIYSTALPPAVCASSIAALDILEKDLSIRKSLWNNVDKFKERLNIIGFHSVESQTHIIPIIIGDSDLTMKFAKGLYGKGIFVPGIRPPTVPENESRLRVCLMATHTDEQIEFILSAFKSEGRRLGII